MAGSISLKRGNKRHGMLGMCVRRRLSQAADAGGGSCWRMDASNTMRLIVMRRDEHGVRGVWRAQSWIACMGLGRVVKRSCWRSTSRSAAVAPVALKIPLFSEW